MWQMNIQEFISFHNACTAVLSSLIIIEKNFISVIFVFIHLQIFSIELRSEDDSDQFLLNSLNLYFALIFLAKFR